jgi:anthranilate phosphoribosyltransferase
MNKCLEKIGYLPLFYPFIYRGMEARIKAASRIIDMGLKLPIAWYPVVFVPFPINIKRRTYGIFSDKFLGIVANIFKELNYEKVIVFHGVDGLDEISNIGSTKIAELNNNKIEEYKVNPSDFGLKKSKFDDIKAVSKENNAKDMLRILYGKEKGAKRDIILMNASGAFYVMGKVKDFKEGTELARNIIEEGKASKVIEDLIKFNGDTAKFESWKKKLKL